MKTDARNLEERPSFSCLYLWHLVLVLACGQPSENVEISVCHREKVKFDLGSERQVGFEEVCSQHFLAAVSNETREGYPSSNPIKIYMSLFVKA